MDDICKQLWSRLTQHERKEVYRNYEVKKNLADKLEMPSNFSLIEAARFTRMAIGRNEEIQVGFLQFADNKENRFVMIADPYQLKQIMIAIEEMLKDMEILKAHKTFTDDLSKSSPIN